MDQKPYLRRGDSFSFLGERNIQILRKSLQHVRKPVFDEKTNNHKKLPRNNSFNNKMLPNVKSPALNSAKIISEELDKNSLQCVNFTGMTASMKTSKMVASMASNKSNLSSKFSKIRMKGIETPSFFAGGNSMKKKSQTSLTRPAHLNQMEQKNMKKLFVLPFKTTNKLIKIMSSERLKTPKKNERNSYNSRGEDRDSNNEKKERGVENIPAVIKDVMRSSFFTIKAKTPLPRDFVSKFEENEGLGVLALPEGDSVIIENNYLSDNFEKQKDNKDNGVNKDNSVSKGNKFSKEEHKKINDMLSSIVEKAQKDEEQKKKGMGCKKSQRLYEVKKINKEILIEIQNTRILSCRFNQEDSLLAIGGEDGITSVLTPNKKSILKSLSDDFCSNNPANNVRWKPKDVNNVLLVTNINGIVTHWDLSKKKFMNQIIESQNVYSADYNLEGLKFAVAGTDATVKIYEQFKLTNCYQGHANRVYALKFHDAIPDLLLSGGWDETLLFWDLRVPQKENPISYIYGPLICGEALDVKGDYILTGSWRDKQQLEVWDMRKMQLLNSLEWTPQKTDDKSYIYSAQFSKLSQNYIIAGSSGASEIRIYQLRNEALYQYECVEILKDLTRSVYTIDFCHETNTFVYGDGNGKVGIVDIL